ncbi:DamX protein [Escherichia coli]|nr:DamX protein [Escherichia coli]
MDEFKPEDELKPDPSDRRTGRSRQSSERSERTERGEPQINFDDIELDDTDDRRPTRAQKERNDEPEIEEEIDESEDEIVDEERVERRPRKRKKAASKPASRQYMMMGVGILVLPAVDHRYRFCAKSPLDLFQRSNRVWREEY